MRLLFKYFAFRFIACVFCGMFFCTAEAQNFDALPYSQKKYVVNESYYTSPDKTYGKQQATNDLAKIIDNNYKIRDTRTTATKNYYDSFKIVAEGAASVIDKLPVPYLSVAVAVGKERMYQIAQENFDDKMLNHKKQFEKKIEGLFEQKMQNFLIENENASYDEAFADFSKNIEAFQKSLKAEDYQIITPIADREIIKYIKNNAESFKKEFNAIKSDVESLKANLDDTGKSFDNKLTELKKELVDYDKALLNDISQNTQGLIKLNEKIDEKFARVETDIKNMQTDIKNNSNEIEVNKRKIETVKNDVEAVRQLQARNMMLTNENTYKIGVITEVLYDNVNTSGKLKLLEMQYKNDTKNPEYTERKNVLENIQAVEDIQSKLAVSTELVKLGENLGLSKQDAEKANKAIAVGNVIANGAMAYFTGNPVAGLQAVNGAFSLFGSAEGNPEFDAIMAEFRKINIKLDEISNKIDTVNENIIELRKLNIELFAENQKRFNDIDKKLERIQTGINNISQQLYAETSSGLMEENTGSYTYLWEDVSNTTNLDKLRKLYNGNMKMQNLIKIVYINTENKTIDQKTFLHFNNHAKSDYWETNIYKPILTLTKRVYPEMDLSNLESPIIYINDYSFVSNKPVKYNEQLLPKLSFSDFDRLIYPQSIITLTEFLSLFEPYYYFYSGSNFNITTNFNDILPDNKNRHLKNQFQNTLRENRKAIIQTNIISGGAIVNYIKKHITEPGFNINEKQVVYDLLTSSNEYFKLNLSTYIINSDVMQKHNLLKMYNILSCADYEKCQKLITDFNSFFENPHYNIKLEGNSNKFSVCLAIKPMNLKGIDASQNEVLLPLPPFDYLYENKVIYPSYFFNLYENLNVLLNKVVKYDIVEKMNKPEYKNLKLIRL